MAIGGIGIGVFISWVIVVPVLPFMNRYGYLGPLLTYSMSISTASASMIV